MVMGMWAVGWGVGGAGGVGRSTRHCRLWKADRAEVGVEGGRALMKAREARRVQAWGRAVMACGEQHNQQPRYVGGAVGVVREGVGRIGHCMGTV